MQLYLPLPHRPASTGRPVQFSKVKVTFREEAEPNFRKMIYAEVLETEPGKVVTGSPAKPQLPEQQVKSLLCWRDGHWQDHHHHHHPHAAELGTWHGAIPLLIWESVNFHPRHSWGLFLPAASWKGMPVRCPKLDWVISPAPTGARPAQHPRFSTATQDSEYICSMSPVDYFLTKHRRSTLYLQ